MSSTTWTTDWPQDVLARYVTVGGAHVDLLSHRFRTNYTAQGRYVSGPPNEVDGFTWTCRGCDTRGAVNVFGDPYLPGERNRAHEAANSHAAECRSIPRPTR